MTSKIDDGGPAFPSHAGDPEATDPRNRISCGGLTKRDYFAANAMVAMLGRDDASPGDLDEGFQTLLDFIARASYRAADALIAASKTGGPEHG